VVDIRALKYVNSSGLGLFLRWIGWISSEHEARRYRLQFVIDPTVSWMS
jgi:hypothetical protein